MFRHKQVGFLCVCRSPENVSNTNTTSDGSTDVVADTGCPAAMVSMVISMLFIIGRILVEVLKPFEVRLGNSSR